MADRDYFGNEQRLMTAVREEDRKKREKDLQIAQEDLDQPQKPIATEGNVVDKVTDSLEGIQSGGAETQ